MPHTTFGLLHAMRIIRFRRLTCREVSIMDDRILQSLSILDQTLSWTANKLKEWYLQPVPELSEDNKTISAAFSGW
jgi:RNA processing factor Prp31